MEKVLLTHVSLEALADEIAKVLTAKLALKDNPAPEESLLTRKEAAALLRVTLPTLRAHTQNGRLKAYRVGRRRVVYKKSELLASMKPLLFL